MIIDTPLFYLYMYGPRLNSYGFWEGQDVTAICHTITGVPEMHWEHNQFICEDLVIRKFGALLALVYFALYILLIRFILSCNCCYKVIK